MACISSLALLLVTYRVLSEGPMILVGIVLILFLLRAVGQTPDKALKGERSPLGRCLPKNCKSCSGLYKNGSRDSVMEGLPLSDAQSDTSEREHDYSYLK